jgi:hypothetical protein
MKLLYIFLRYADTVTQIVENFIRDELIFCWSIHSYFPSPIKVKAAQLIGSGVCCLTVNIA